MKKAEIIKNGNVNLKPIKNIDWQKVELDYILWLRACSKHGMGNPTPSVCFDWIKERLS